MKILHIYDGSFEIVQTCVCPPALPPPKKRYSVNVDFLWLQEPDMLLKALWDVSFG